MIFRNDDVSWKTEVKQFAEVHKLFIKYNVLHTVALICKDIELNPELIQYINANNIDVQVHCWEHVDFVTLTEAEMHLQFKQCVATIRKYFKHTPDTFYPPWNKSNDHIERVSKYFGLTVSNKKISIQNYLAGKTGEVINFHSWSDECEGLEQALKIYTKCA